MFEDLTDDFPGEVEDSELWADDNAFGFQGRVSGFLVGLLPSTVTEI